MEEKNALITQYGKPRALAADWRRVHLTTCHHVRHSASDFCLMGTSSSGYHHISTAEDHTQCDCTTRAPVAAILTFNKLQVSLTDALQPVTAVLT